MTKYSAEQTAAITKSIEAVPLCERTNISTLSEKNGIPKSTVHDLLKRGVIRHHTASLKPLLTTKHRLDRIKHALSFLRVTREGAFEFDSMLDYVHVDEKWFFIKSDGQKYYLSADEKEPLKATKSKRFIEKVMVLVAVARPRFDAHGKCLFDGKIGVWPFVEHEPAQRSSKNRPRGTLIMKDVKVDRDVYCRMLVDDVIPAIKSRWPAGHRRVLIQQDNARPHVTPKDPAVVAAACADGWDMRMASQPANSPDTNVLDLGFFASIQSLQQRKVARSRERLLQNVYDSFEELEYQKIDRVFMTLQSVLIEISKHGGGNGFKIPHLHKSSIPLVNGLLPLSISCENEAIDCARAVIDQQGISIENDGALL